MSFFYGLVLFVGFLTGRVDPLNPLQAQPRSPQPISNPTSFTKLANIEALESVLKQAQNDQQPVLVDLYADWCVSCKVIEKEVFGNAAVTEKLAKWKPIKLDVTESTPEQMAWLSQRNVFGPPAVFFYSPNGEEIKNSRIAGAVSLDKFLTQFPQL